MRRVEIVRRPTTAERDELIGFVEALTGRRGSRPISDHLWLDLNAGGSDGFIAVSIADTERILAYAQVSGANDGAVLEAVLADGIADGIELHEDLIDTVIDAFARTGGGHLTWWVDDADEHTRALAARHALTPTRALHEMRTALPLRERSTVETRPFRTTDAEAWLRVNNSAFAEHGEQGGWTLDTLRLRLDEPWFDADGFRLYEHDGTVMGFCWTKVHSERVHSESDPPIGEIYVIAVDPELHGRGLGRELTLAGLDWLSDHGIRTAMLYVDAGNTAAVRLYERLGFEVRRTRSAFAGTLEPPVGPTGAT